MKTKSILYAAVIMLATMGIFGCAQPQSQGEIYECYRGVPDGRLVSCGCWSECTTSLEDAFNSCPKDCFPFPANLTFFKTASEVVRTGSLFGQCDAPVDPSFGRQLLLSLAEGTSCSGAGMVSILHPERIRLASENTDGTCDWDTGNYECYTTQGPMPCCRCEQPSEECPHIGRYYCGGAETKSVCTSKRFPPGSVASVAKSQTALVTADDGGQGSAIGKPGTRAFAFDKSASGLTIDFLGIPFSDFVFEDEARREGSAVLTTLPITVPQQGSDPNIFAIPAGAATFALSGVDGGDAVGLVATNSTPLIISIGDATGPRLTGVVRGPFQGHQVEAAIDARFLWVNRPPVAVARASQTVVAERDPDDVCKVLGAYKNVVRLDASKSFDPDPGDSLIYSWNLGGRSLPPTKSPITALELPQAKYVAFLTVQDAHGVSAVTQVPVTVLNSAFSDFGCDLPQRFEKPVLVRKPEGSVLSSVSPQRIAAVQRFAHTTSNYAASISVNAKTLPEIKAMAPKPSIAIRVYKTAAKFQMGAVDVPDGADPFAGLCPADTSGLADGMAAVCRGCGNGMCTEGETCVTCEDDCGPCIRCGDGSCMQSENCGNCELDCGRCDPCGDGICRESTSACPVDCYCGNGTCDLGEDNGNCPGECYCGNGACDPGEDGTNCPTDCYCGDAICSPSEDNTSCPIDCPCGDGVCGLRDNCLICPSDCGECPRLRVFITAGTFSGSIMGGLAGADAKCQLEAQAAGLPGTYKAWLSDSTTSVSARFTHGALPYALTDGTRVADEWGDLTDGSIDAPIVLMADGTERGIGGVWTATDPSGGISYPANTCSNWTSDGGLGADGYAGATHGDWTLNSVQPLDSCSVSSPLYCFQQENP